ncbi:MAG: outer membrane beta-barrel protein, partial [Bacteroidetes bacterium]|nr:outer membrane beta-barrel protein [Bacteroidota bacterium]
KTNQPLASTGKSGEAKFSAGERSIKNNSIHSSYRNKINNNKSALQHKNHGQIVNHNKADAPQTQNEIITANDDVMPALRKGTLVAITPVEPVINLKNPSQKSSVPLTNNTAPAQKKNNIKAKYFYAGIVAAPDFSTIKMQSIKGSGYTAGILLGYKFSSNLSIETGAYFDSKKYYTDGKYFSTKNVSWLRYTDLKHVDGWCNMIDVPVNLRYNFSATKKNSWFAAAGLSTYFMFKENYTYDYEYNGSYYNSSAGYTKGSQNWFSIINISAGYEHNIGKTGSLRLEPYLKVPLTGMGTGSLPIMSVGLNIGIIHQFK